MVAINPSSFPSKSGISTQITDGFHGRKTEILYFFSFLTITFYFLQFWLKDWNFLTVDPKFCPEDNKECNRPDLLAYCFGSFICQYSCGLLGIYVWMVSKSAHNAIPSTPEGRLFGYLRESETIAVLNLTFQVWNFLVSLWIPEYCTKIDMSHHVMAAIVSWYSIRYQFLHYYGVFFLGLSEASSMFLVVITTASHFPPEPNTLYSAVLSVSEIAFTVVFTLTRVIFWAKVSLLLWSDVIAVIKNGNAERLRPGKVYVLYVYLVMNILLWTMQLYWFCFLILPEVLNVVLGTREE